MANENRSDHCKDFAGTRLDAEVVGKGFSPDVTETMDRIRGAETKRFRVERPCWKAFKSRFIEPPRQSIRSFVTGKRTIASTLLLAGRCAASRRPFVDPVGLCHNTKNLMNLITVATQHPMRFRVNIFRIFLRPHLGD